VAFLPRFLCHKLKPIRLRSASRAAQAPTQAQPAPADHPPMMLVQAPVQAASPAAKPAAPTGVTSPVLTEADANVESGGVGVREFQGDDVGQVLRLLARSGQGQHGDTGYGTVTIAFAKSDRAAGDLDHRERPKAVFMDKIDNVFYIKTPAEKTAEPPRATLSVQLRPGQRGFTVEHTHTQIASANRRADEHDVFQRDPQQHGQHPEVLVQSTNRPDKS